ncbi:MAG: TolC family protein [Bacteroidia bacterium]|nr:TolC family protein [Bacteroidia bacterium]
MKRAIWIVTLFLIYYNQEISAQEKKWTLEDCITYAVTNNIGLKRQRLQTQTAEVNFLKSKMDILPSINMGSDASIQYGRSIDPITNIYTFLQNFRNGYDLTSSIRLFNGFATLNTISANKFLLKAGLENEKIVRNTLIIDIMGQYYQVLYSKGLASASKMQLDLSEKQLFRILKMVETGKEALSKQYEIESQVSADKLAYTIAQNSASQALTSLKQMLQLVPGSDFNILMPDLNNMLITDNNFNTDSIYNIASQTLPRLKAIEFELIASKKQIAVARGNLAPSLSLGGSVFTGYYTLLNDTSAHSSFSEQLHNNFGQAVGVSLNIPIFNNYSTSRTIKLAKIRRNDNELRLQQEKNNLYIDIENACLNYNRGKDEFAAAKANYDFNIKSFNAVEKKFESGLVNVTEYSVAKTTLFKAETEALRTKLQVLIRKLTIQFYSTGEYEKIIIN